jgi:hypothetical protein
MVAALDAGAGPEIVTWPMLLAGLAVVALIAVFFSRRIPTQQPSTAPASKPST